MRNSDHGTTYTYTASRSAIATVQVGPPSPLHTLLVWGYNPMCKVTPVILHGIVPSDSRHT